MPKIQKDPVSSSYRLHTSAWKRFFVLFSIPASPRWEEMPTLLSLRLTAGLLSVHPNTLRQWDRPKGPLRAVRIGRRQDRRYKKEEVYQLWDRQTSALPQPKRVAKVRLAGLVAVLLVPVLLFGSAALVRADTSANRTILALPGTCSGWTGGAQAQTIDVPPGAPPAAFSPQTAAIFSSASTAVQTDAGSGGTVVGSLDAFQPSITCSGFATEPASTWTTTASTSLEVSLYSEAAANSSDVIIISGSLDDGASWFPLSSLSAVEWRPGYVQVDLGERIRSSADLAKLRVRFEVDTTLTDIPTRVFLDGLRFMAPVARLASSPVTNSARIIRRLDGLTEFSKSVYRAMEQPVVTVPKKKVKKLLFFKTGVETWSIASIHFSDSTGTTVQAEYREEVVSQGTDEQSRLWFDPASLHPGKYKVQLAMVSSQSGTVTVEEEFLWGVLALNPTRAVPAVGDEEVIGMGVLDDAGKTICDASIKAVVTDPKGRRLTFSTDKNIIRNPDCVDKGVTNKPDYRFSFKIERSGVYHVRMEADTPAGQRVTEENIQAEEHPSFDVERVDYPTRIYPPAEYPVRIAITPNQDFSGTVEETIPRSFAVSGLLAEATLMPVADNALASIITWPVEWKAGSTYFLSYTFDAPDISPALFKTGPLQIGGSFTELPVWQEPRQWQIASDHAVSPINHRKNTLSADPAVRNKDIPPTEVKNVATAVRAVKADFTLDESPKLIVDVDQPKAVKKRSIKMIELVDANGQFLEIAPQRQDQGPAGAIVTALTFNSQSLPHPGKYRVLVTFDHDGFAPVAAQDFTWGVLAVNVRRAIERPETDTTLGLAVLDDGGRTLCDASLNVMVTNPAGQVTTLTTQDGTIGRNPKCADKSVTNDFDYAAPYHTTTAGTYRLHVVAETANGQRVLDDSFEVRDQVGFDIERTTFSMRIYPVPAYDQSLTIGVHTDYTGPVTESVPASFGISAISNGGIAVTVGDRQIITWNVDWTAGQTQTLGYTIQFPLIYPEYYQLGPLAIGEFKEGRQWQVASDAACTGSTTGNWSTGGNWTGCTGAGGIPASGDTITINSGIVMTVDTGNPTVSSLAIASTTGANGVSVSTGQLLTVTNGLSFTANAGTGTQTVTMNGTGNITAGSLTINAPTSSGSSNITCATSATGTLTVTNGFAISGNSTASQTGAVTVDMLTCTLTAGTITITGGSVTAAELKASTGTLTSNGAWSFGGTAGNAKVTTSGAATVNTSGNFPPGGTPSFNAASTFVVNGSMNLGNYTYPNVTLAAGTMTQVSNITVAGNWTNNSGTGARAGNFTVFFAGVGKTIGGTFLTAFYGVNLNNGSTTTLNTNATIGAGNLVWAANNGVTSLTHASGIDLTITGSVTLTQPAAAITSSWIINAGTATVSGTVTFTGTNTNARINKIILTTGTLTLNAATSLAFDTDTTVSNQVIDMSGGAGTLNIAGSITNPGNATSTPGTTSTWNFNGTAAQTIPVGTASNTFWGGCTTQCYAKLTINNTHASGATMGNTVASGNISDNVTVGDGANSAIFSNGGFAMAGASGKVFTVNNSSTFNMTGTSTYPTGFSTFTYGATSTVNYKQTSSPLTLTAATYGHLGLVPAGTATQTMPAATMTVAGNLTIGDATNAATVVADASNSLLVAGNWTTAASSVFTHSNGTVTFNATASGKTIDNRASSFYNVIFNGSGGTWKPATNDMTLANDLTMTVGTLQGNGALNITVNGHVACGATCGTIDTTANSGTGTFTQSVASAKNFGTSVTADTTNWTFYNLTFTASPATTISTSTTPTSPGSETITNVLTISASTTLNAGSRVWILSGGIAAPLVKTGTFTYATSTMRFTGNSSTVVPNALSGTGGTDGYYNLELKPGGAVTYTLGAGTYAVNNNLTIGDASNAGIISNSTNNAVVTVTGDLVMNTSATLSGSGTGTFTVNGGDVTGDGTINLTGNTFLVDGTGNFGGATAWTFFNLTFGDGSGTTTTTSTGSGGITASNVLTIAANQTLDAKIKSWTLSGTTGTPLVITGVLNDSTDTSTFSFTGNNSGGNTTVPNSTAYNNVTVNNGSETFVLNGTTTLSGTLTITAGTLDTVTGQGYAINVAGSFTNSATFTAQTGTVTMTGTGTLTTGSSSLNNFTTSGSGTVTLANATHTIAGNLTLGSTATIAAGTSTVTMSGTSKTLDGGGQTLNNLSISGTVTLQNTNLVVSAALAVSDSKSLSLNASRTLTLSGNTGTTLNLNTSGTVSGSGALIYQNSATTLTTSGTISSAFTFDMVNGSMSAPVRTLGGAVVVKNGSGAARTLTLGTAGSQTLVFSSSLDLQSTSAGSTLTLVGNTNNPIITMTGSFTNSNATAATTVSMGSGTWTVSGSFDLTNVGTFNHNSGKLVMGGTGTLTSNSKVLNNLDVNSAGTVTLAGATHTLAGNLLLGGAGTPTVTSSTIDMTGSGKTITGGNKTLNNLTLSDNTTLQTSDLTVSGTLTVAIGKTLTINASRTLTHSGSTLSWGDSASTIAGPGTLGFTSTSGGPGTSGTISAITRFNASGGDIASTTLDARTYDGRVEFYSNSATNRTATFATGTYNVFGASSHLYIIADGAGDMTLTGGANNPTVAVAGDVKMTGTGAGTEVWVSGNNTWTISGSVDTSPGFFAPQMAAFNPTWDNDGYFEELYFDDLGICTPLSSTKSCGTASSTTVRGGMNNTADDCTPDQSHTDYRAYLKYDLSSLDNTNTVIRVDQQFNVTTPGDNLSISRASNDSPNGVACGSLYDVNASLLYNGLDTSSTGHRFVNLLPGAVAEVQAKLGNSAYAVMLGGGSTTGTTFNSTDHASDKPILRVGYIAASTTPTIEMDGSGTLTVGTGSFYNLTLSGTITVDASSTVYVHKNFILNGTITNNTAALVMTGASSTLNGGGNTIGNLTLYPGASVTLSTDNLTISNGFAVNTGASLTISSGLTLTHDAATLLLDGTITGAGTFTMTNDSSGPGTTGTLSSVVRYDATDGNIASTTFDARTYGGALQLYSNTGSARSITTATGTYLFSSSLTTTAAGAGVLTVDFNTNDPTTTTVTGAMAVGATTIFSAQSSGTFNINGNYTNSGTFTDNSGTVTLAGSSQQTLSGTMTTSSDFNNMTVTNSSGSDPEASPSVIFGGAATVSGTFTASTANTKLRFNAGSTFTFNNVVLNGQSSTFVYLRSSTPGTQWNLTSAGTQTVSNTNVRDSYACGGDTINATDGTNVDAGNNSCWDIDTISISISDTGIGFGELSISAATWANGAASGSSTDTAAHTISIATNADNGYALSYYGPTLAAGGLSIDVASITNDADGTPGSEQFAMSFATNGNATIASGYDHNATAGQRDWNFTPSTTTTIVSETGPTATEVISSYYLCNIAATTEPGSYAADITYVMSAAF